MKNIILTAGLLLTTTSVFAATTTLYGDTKVFTADFNSESAALNAGNNLADNLPDMAPGLLRHKLGLVSSSVDVHNITVDQTQIRLDKFNLPNSQPQYRAILDVKYHYTGHDED
jgi:hypothetical protein